MDFSEIGVRSRKTGLRAKENVRKDEDNMEDIDDFFTDEQTTLVQPQPQQAPILIQQQQQRQATTATTTVITSNIPTSIAPSAAFSGSPKRHNGRIIFPSNKSRPHSTSAESVRNSPLRSPLQSRPSTHDDDLPDDLFTDAYEQPMVLDTQDIDDMEIDDESKGVIKLVNDTYEQQDDESFGNDISIHEDEHRVPIPTRSPVKSKQTSKQGAPLFISSDDSAQIGPSRSDQGKSIGKQHLELDSGSPKRSKNLPGSSSKLQHFSLSSTPKPQRELEPIVKESPLRSTILNSPLQPSRKKMASFSKAMALNRRRIRDEPVSDDEASEDSDGDSFNDEDYTQDKDGEDDDDDDDEEDDEKEDGLTEPSGQSEDSEEDVSVVSRSGLGRKRLSTGSEEEFNDTSKRLAPQISRNGRQNKFQRSAMASPSSRQHKIAVNELRKQQSRSASSNKQQIQPAEHPTRRSSRVRIPPLAFWRNERAVYEKTKKDVVPTLKEIITVDEVQEPIRNRTRPASKAGSRRPSRQTSRASSKNRGTALAKPHLKSLAEEDESGEEEAEEVNGIGSKTGSFNKNTKGGSERSSSNNELQALFDDTDKDQDDVEEDRVQQGLIRGSEWLKNGFLKVDAFEGHGSDLKSNRLIAWAPGTENFSNSIVTDEDNFKLAILFDKNREFIAAGMMLIPQNGIKSLKSTDTTYFVFYCISGVVEVTLSGNVFLIKKGCSLEVPMGNFYQFVNKGKKDATLFFVQTRGHDVDEWDEE